MKITTNFIIIILILLIILKKDNNNESFSTSEKILKCQIDIKICKNNEDSELCQNIKKIYNLDELPDNEIIFCSNY